MYCQTVQYPCTCRYLRALPPTLYCQELIGLTGSPGAEGQMRTYRIYILIGNAYLLQGYLTTWVGRQLEVINLPMYTNGSGYTHVVAAPFKHATLVRPLHQLLTAAVLPRSHVLVYCTWGVYKHLRRGVNAA